jgi:hypothetical protein
MAIALDSIEVGKCYVTAMGQVRRVLDAKIAVCSE